MSISIISSGFTPSSDYANSIAHSVTASAGDIIFITLGYKDESSAVFSAPTWNSQTATPCGVRYNQNGLFLHDFYIRVASSATANLTSSSGDSYTRINSGYAVIRSSGNLFPSVPLKNSDLPAQPTKACINRKENIIVEQQTCNDWFKFFGLTKREELAKAAMQGLCSAHDKSGTWSHDPITVAIAAVEYADALLAALDK